MNKCFIPLLTLTKLCEGKRKGHNLKLFSHWGSLGSGKYLRSLNKEK